MIDRVAEHCVWCCSDDHGHYVLHQRDLCAPEIGRGLLLRRVALPCRLQLFAPFYWFWFPSEYSCEGECVFACVWVPIHVLGLLHSSFPCSPQSVCVGGSLTDAVGRAADSIRRS